MAKGGGTTRTGGASNPRGLANANSIAISNFEKSFSDIRNSVYSRRDIESLGTKELNNEYKNLLNSYRNLVEIDPGNIDDSTFTREDDRRLGALSREYLEFVRKLQRTVNRYEQELDKRY